MGWLGCQPTLLRSIYPGHLCVGGCSALPRSMTNATILRCRNYFSPQWPKGKTGTLNLYRARILRPMQLIAQCSQSTEGIFTDDHGQSVTTNADEKSVDVDGKSRDDSFGIHDSGSAQATTPMLEERLPGSGRIETILAKIEDAGVIQQSKPFIVGFFACAVIVYIEEPLLYATEMLLSSRSKRILALLMCTFLILGLGALAWHNATGDGFWDALYNSWSFIAAPDNRELARTSERLIAALLTIGGFFTFSIIISFTTEFFVDTANRIASGQGRVVERDHSVILGWSPEVHMAVRELGVVCATEPGFNRKVVVVAEQPKEVVDDTLKHVLGEYAAHVNLVTRVGCIKSVGDVYKYSLRRAKRVIVIADYVRDSDVYKCIPTLLSLKKTLEQWAYSTKSYPTTIFLSSMYCPLYNKILRNISFPGLHYLDGGSFVSRLLGKTVTCLPGICSIFQNIFAFEGSEFHLKSASEISGRTFGVAIRQFDEAQCIGVLQDSEFLFCPQDELELQKDDTLVLLAENQGRCQPLERPLPPVIVDQLDFSDSIYTFDNFKLLICGWRTGTEKMLQDIDKVSAPGSIVTIVSKKIDRHIRKRAFEYEYTNILLYLEDGNPIDGDTLLKCGIGSADCIVFARDEGSRLNYGRFAVEELPYDTQLLAFMLVLEEIRQNRQLKEGLRVTCEVEDEVYVNMLNRQIVTDILIPSKILGSVACQLAVSPQLSQIFNSLLSSVTGVFLYIVPMPSIFCGYDIEFRRVVEACRPNGQIPIGVIKDDFAAVAPNEVFEFSPSHKLVVMRKDEEMANNISPSLATE